MAIPDDFDSIVEAFHKTIIITNSKGTKAYKQDVQQSRENAENQAGLRLSKHWGRWNYSDFEFIIETLNWNGFETGKRFGPWMENNIDRINQKEIEQVQDAFVVLLDGPNDIISNISEFKRSYGTAPEGLVSCILYLHNPFEFAPMIKEMVDNLLRFDLTNGQQIKYRLRDYEKYSVCVKQIENDFSIPPQLSDYFLTTWIKVWGNK